MFWTKFLLCLNFIHVPLWSEYMLVSHATIFLPHETIILLATNLQFIFFFFDVFLKLKQNNECMWNFQLFAWSNVSTFFFSPILKKKLFLETRFVYFQFFFSIDEKIRFSNNNNNSFWMDFHEWPKLLYACVTMLTNCRQIQWNQMKRIWFFFLGKRLALYRNAKREKNRSV